MMRRIAYKIVEQFLWVGRVGFAVMFDMQKVIGWLHLLLEACTPQYVFYSHVFPQTHSHRL